MPNYYNVLQIFYILEFYLGSGRNLNTQIKPGFYADRSMQAIAFDSRLSLVNIRIETRCEMCTTRRKKSASSWIRRYFKVHSSNKYCTYEKRTQNDHLIVKNSEVSRYSEANFQFSLLNSLHSVWHNHVTFYFEVSLLIFQQQSMLLKSLF